MLYWSVISGASFLLILFLDDTSCGTVPKPGVHPKYVSGLASGLNKTLVDSPAAYHGDSSPKDQSSLRKKEKPLNDRMMGSNDTVARRLFPGSKRGSINHDDTHSLHESSPVAFTVNNQGPAQGPYPTVKIVTFNKVITNLGGGFDPMFSVFTCKVSGYYFFSVSILSTIQHNVVANLVHDGRDITQAYGHPPHGTAVMTAFLHVAAGGRVWVSLGIGSAVDYTAYHSFSGYLVKPDAAT